MSTPLSYQFPLWLWFVEFHFGWTFKWSSQRASSHSIRSRVCSQITWKSGADRECDATWLLNSSSKCLVKRCFKRDILLLSCKKGKKKLKRTRRFLRSVDRTYTKGGGRRRTKKKLSFLFCMGSYPTTVYSRQKQRRERPFSLYFLIFKRPPSSVEC